MKLEEQYFIKLVATAIAASMLCGCIQAPDWTSMHSEREKPIKRVDVVQTLVANSALVVAGTQNGAVLVSKDAGKNWMRKSLPGASLIDLAACPDGTFVGIDFHGRVWSGNEGAEGWRAHQLENPKTPLAITCDGKNRWWVTGTRATLASSADQGASWRTIDMNADTQITTIQFVDDVHGIALGEFGMVLTTEDGGKGWTQQPPIPSDFYPYAALFISRDQGWASGIAGRILATRDGGKTWRPQDNESGMPLYRLFLHQGVPHGVGAGGTLARLEQERWRIVYYPDAAPVFLGAGSSLPTLSTVVLGGPGGLLRTVDARKN